MESTDEICKKFVVQNALEHGKAKVGAVLGLIFKTYPELRKELESIKPIVEHEVEKINALSPEEVEAIARENFPELIVSEDSEQQQQSVDFIREIINEHMKTGRFGGKVHTRFPPEPNGYLHIGHALSVYLNYSIARDYNGKFNLRFDDTNPATEEEEYVKAIIEDVKWLGADFEDRIFYASDYFDKMYEYAVQLIKKGLAYVDDLSVEEIRRMRGSLTEPGIESPYRNRSVEENLELFERMKNGEFPDGAKVLRAKIDMNHPNLLMRDPIMYRIIHKPHHNTGDRWCIYPTYDWAHGLEDSIEGITHSICTLEFEVHRPLYDWFLDQLEDENGKPIHHPQQIEFARLNLSHTVLSKRKLLKLVKEGYVNGWDDPRLHTIVAMRRRGVPAEAINKFCATIGVSKRERIIDQSILENSIREVLDNICPRVMCVLRPLKVVITNYPEDLEEEFEVPNHPRDKSFGTRKVPFTRELYIESDDFMEHPPEGYKRLTIGKEVRLKYAYFIKCEKAIKDDSGNIVELHCTYDPETKGGEAPDGRKVDGTIHWISAKHALKAEIRLYDRLFTKVDPLEVEEGKDFTDYINPNSLEIVKGLVEPWLAKEKVGSRFQFERKGYFAIDLDTNKDRLVFNRIITLKDTWKKA